MAEAPSDDLWVIDPSDLTFDPAFLDGLYQAPNVSLGPRVPPLAREDKAVAPKEPLTAEASVVPADARPAASVAAVPESLGVPPALETTTVAPADQAVTREEPVAAVAAGDARPAASVAPEPEQLEVLPALEATWPAVQESPAPIAASVAEPVAGSVEVVVDAVVEAAAEPVVGAVAEPVVEAVAPDRPLGAAAPSASLAPEPEPLEVLPALDANWPFVEELPAPIAASVAEPVAGSVEAAVEAVAEPVAGAVAEPVVEAIAPDRPLGAAGPPASLAPEPEPLEVLPALEAGWPFVQESPALVAEAVAKLVSESVATPAATLAAASVATPVAEVVAESAAAPIAGAAAPDRPLDVVAPSPGKEPTPAEVVSGVLAAQMPVPHATTPAVEDPGIQEAVEVFERLLDSFQEVQATPAVALPGPEGAPLGAAFEKPAGTGEQVAALDEAIATAPAPEPEVLVSVALDETSAPIDAELAQLASHGPMPAAEIELNEAPALPIDVFGPESRPWAGDDAGEALRPEAAPAVIPAPAAAPPTLRTASAPAAAAAAPPGDQAPPHGEVSASPGGRVLTFEPAPIRGEPAVFTPTEETPSAPDPAHVLAFAVREKAAKLARAVLRRLIELGRTPVRWRQTAAAALILVALGGVPLATTYWFRTPPPTGGLIVETAPDGLDVFIDKALRGRTPMSLTLPAGDHVLELRGKGLTRTLPVRIVPGVQAEERVSWPLSARTGRLHIESEPTRATVSIDGESRGVTPLTIEDLPARFHTLVVQSRGSRVERSVMIEPDQITMVRVPVYPGWMKVFSPFDLQIFESGRPLGSSDVDRVMLRAGRHAIEFVNEELGYRVVRQVDIKPGDLTPVSIELPNGTVQIEAPPGFEVWLDGERVGETPLSPLEVSLGTHEVRLKHPQAGEQRQVVVVTQRGPAKVTAEGK